MLASITPLGERGRGQRWWLTVAALTVGGGVSGAAVGASLAAVGAVLPLDASSRLASLLAVGAVALAVALLGVPVPTHRRQVDDAWLHRYRGWVYGLGFGVQLGAGVWTIVTTEAVYVTLAAEALAPSAAAGAAIGAVFGVLRGLSVLATARVDSPARLTAFHRWLHRWERLAHRGALAGQAAVLVAAAATL